jgi:hypothetical protein
MNRIALLPLIALAATACSDTVTSPTPPPAPRAAVVATVSPENAKSGTHLQAGAIGCSVGADLSVSCSGFELAGVGHTNAEVSLIANYTATVDCYNPGVNPNNPIESHETSFSAEQTFTVTSTKNGRLLVPATSVDPNAVAQGCPNPNWTPTIREGTLALTSFSYSLTFDDFENPYILVTGP